MASFLATISSRLRSSCNTQPSKHRLHLSQGGLALPRQGVAQTFSLFLPCYTSMHSRPWVHSQANTGYICDRVALHCLSRKLHKPSVVFRLVTHPCVVDHGYTAQKTKVTCMHGRPRGVDKFSRHSPNWQVVLNYYPPSQETPGPIYRNCQ
jgi:hypothetical protein